MSEHLSPALEWTLFLALASAAILCAYRMLRTMSMVRAGLSLMASFCAVAGLFLVLSADLLAAMQIMMYVGGMLVMIVFMVMMSPDPGGSMMGIAPPEEGKGMDHGGMKHGQTQQQGMQYGRMQKDEDGGKAKQYTCPTHPEILSDSPGKCPKCGMQLQLMSEEEENGGMQMDMAMTHEFTKPAAALGIAVGAALVWAILTVDWPAAAKLPADFDSGRILGKELLSRYMIGFEAAAILIILGVVGAVIFGRRE